MVKLSFPELPDSVWDNIELLGLAWLFVWLLFLSKYVGGNVSFVVGFGGFILFGEVGIRKLILPILLTHCSGVLSANIVSYNEAGEPIAAHVDIPFIDSTPTKYLKDGSWEKTYIMPSFRSFHHHEVGRSRDLNVRSYGPPMEDDYYGKCEIEFMGQALDYGHVAIVTLYDRNDPRINEDLTKTPSFLMETARERYVKIEHEGMEAFA